MSSSYYCVSPAISQAFQDGECLRSFMCIVAQLIRFNLRKVGCLSIHRAAESLEVRGNLQSGTLSKWAMLDLNQRLPPCKLTQRFPSRYCPVGKSSLSERFLPFLAPLFSCSVRMRSAPVAARLRRLSLPTAACGDAAVGIIGGWKPIHIFFGRFQHRRCTR